VARHLAIGDIHGCVSALRLLLEFVAPADDDIVITLGDYVDRGPDSRGVIDLLIDLGQTCRHVALRGNHEIMMLDARDKKSWLHPWLRYGGEATLRSYGLSADTAGSFEDIPDAHIDFLENRLLPYYECETHFFVHAYADAGTALDNQSDANLYWRKYSTSEAHCSGKIMVCGHTPQRSGLPVVDEHAICIDTRAFDAGWLSCLDVEAEKVFQANEAGEKRSFSLEEVESLR